MGSSPSSPVPRVPVSFFLPHLFFTEFIACPEGLSLCFPPVEGVFHQFWAMFYPLTWTNFPSRLGPPWCPPVPPLPSPSWDFFFLFGCELPLFCQQLDAVQSPTFLFLRPFCFDRVFTRASACAATKAPPQF